MEVLTILCLSFIIGTAICLNNRSEDCDSDPDADCFYYFAYGSNLFPSRMHINCPSAENVSAGILEGWRLDFNQLPKLSRWNGAVATIVEDENTMVMGNIWRIPKNESDTLDEQEGVNKNWYKKTNVTVKFLTGSSVISRVYIMIDQPGKVEPEEIPPERQPSRTYLQVIIFGAIGCNIPVIHVEYIQRFPHNGKIAPSGIRKALGYPFYDETFQ